MVYLARMRIEEDNFLNICDRPRSYPFVRRAAVSSAFTVGLRSPPFRLFP